MCSSSGSNDVRDPTPSARTHKRHAHGILQQESEPRNYLWAAGESVATNASQPWNVVAGLATDARNALVARLRSVRSSTDGTELRPAGSYRCV